MIKLLFCLCILAVVIIFSAIQKVVDVGRNAMASVTGKGEKERFIRMAETAYGDIRSMMENTGRMCMERGVDLSNELDINDLIVRPIFQNFFNAYPAEDMVKIAVAYCFYKQTESENTRDAIYAAAIPLVHAMRWRGEAHKIPEAWGGTAPDVA